MLKKKINKTTLNIKETNVKKILNLLNPKRFLFLRALYNNTQKRRVLIFSQNKLIIKNQSQFINILNLLVKNNLQTRSKIKLQKVPKRPYFNQNNKKE